MSLRTLMGNLRRFRGAQGGSAAVEFALVGPLFAGAVVALADVANIMTGVGEMQTGMRAASQYAMNGGIDMGIAQTQGLQAWSHRPSGATLSATRACFCASTAADCTIPCPVSGNIPETYVTVSATGTWTGNMISRTQSLTQKVRQR